MRLVTMEEYSKQPLFGPIVRRLNTRTFHADTPQFLRGVLMLFSNMSLPFNVLDNLFINFSYLHVCCIICPFRYS
jgi:hypothetical protein